MEADVAGSKAMFALGFSNSLLMCLVNVGLVIIWTRLCRPSAGMPSKIIYS